LILMESVTVVTGAGGFIGGHMVRELRARGVRRIRAVDVKPLNEWVELPPDVEKLQLDLRDADACRRTAGASATTLRLALASTEPSWP